MQNVLASSFAAFVASRPEFPAEARQLAVDTFTDCVGCMFAGSTQPVAEKLRTIVPLSLQPGGIMIAPCPTLKGFTTSADAALYGATINHALDYDDVSHPGHAHPGTLIVPALLALTPHVEATGADLVSAFICGFELIGKLGRAMNPAHFEYGWHPTPTLGPLGVALAASSLLRLNEEQIIAALGIAASAAAGVRANFGTMVKPLHAGQASRAGVVAALLAREGFTASSEALEHRFGYFVCFSGGVAANLSHLETPGEPLEILSEFGHALKPYPSCAATHPAIEAAILLHGELAGQEIERVHVATSALTFKPLIYDRPATPLEGKFSLPFCVAAGLADGEVMIDTFSDAKLAARSVQSLLGKISLGIDREFEHSHEYGAAIVVETASGQRFEKRVPLARGKPGRRLTEDELNAKFEDCTRRTHDVEASSRLFRALRAIDGPRPAFNIAMSLAAA